MSVVEPQGAKVREPILPPGPPGFAFEWERESDARYSWEWDDMHMPEALSPLSGDYVRCMGQGFAYRYAQLGVAVDIEARVWNGYAYFTATSDLEPDEVSAIWESMPELRRSVIPSTAGYWSERAIPELRASYAVIEAIDAAAMGPEDLAAAWDESWARVERAWRIHFFAITGVYQVLNDLADQYEALVPEASAGEALKLIQGSVTEVQDVADGLDRLTDLARSDPAVAAWLATDLSEPMPVGHAFQEALEEFLRRHGHLGQSWDDLQLSSWRIEPVKLLRDIGKRLEQPADAAVARRQHLAEDADALLERVRLRAAKQPDQLRMLEETLEHARQIGPISETHNYWIDRMAQDALHRLALRVGERLVASGVIDAPADAFYLHRDEIRDLILDPTDQRELVAVRREEHEQQRATPPPRWVGQPPEGGGTRFETPEPIPHGKDEVRGAGASPGTVRGPARVALGQDDFERIQPGDIIVCPSSNPSWVPLFSIAAGLVTDTGGVLSHAAVVARELGLPAVVGTREGTTTIRDGQLIEIDGSSGIVRLL
ncbi:MAG TPA: PEP-utilizing enzyme [Candidatus Limnocylindria bacterium]|jgi:pyruvate,water dikinase|nr:PEP-utilizing enzyme [Candidatus Limnocylindria bacterium]